MAANHTHSELHGAVGNTPLLRLHGVATLSAGVSLFAELESCNRQLDQTVARVRRRAIDDPRK